MHPSDALRDRRADVDGDEFRAERFVLQLRDGVGDLEVEELVSTGWRGGGRRGKGGGKQEWGGRGRKGDRKGKERGSGKREKMGGEGEW